MQRKKNIDVKNANIQIKRYNLINISQASIFSLNLQFLFIMWTNISIISLLHTVIQTRNVMCPLQT